jgi:hydrogenase/urease accessory protein HupE
MMRVLSGVCVLVLAFAAPASAHPAPFSYLDVGLASGSLNITVVAHSFDLAHDLSIEPAERLLEPAFVASQTRGLVSLLQSRFQVQVDGRPIACEPSDRVEILAERLSLKFHVSCAATRIGVVTVHALMFPYDPNHQTFLNVYEGDDLRTQAILDGHHTTFEYFAGTRQGVTAVVRKFVAAGIHHILIGPDHLLFLVGLLLLGGSLRQLLLVVTAFTVAHSITLSLAALNFVTPSARLVEPAIALSIVYVGADNLLVHGGRDVRAWIAFAFGFVHGFGFASVLREMDLPRRALGWSLFSFNLGVEIGQLCVVIAVAAAFAWLRSRSEVAGRRLAFAGSLVVMAAGAFWFVQRVFFPGGMS